MCYNGPMSVSAVPLENRFVTHTDWEGYQRFLEAVGDRRIRVTYDGTMVEIMTPSHRHESLKSLLGALLECLMDEWDVDFQSGGNTTFKQVLKKKGLEPDECYWIASWREVLGEWEADNLSPPDLAIEVEVSRSVLDRLSIYAALGVPELWRVNEEGTISLWCLEGESYRQTQESPSFPKLPLDFFHESLKQASDLPTSRILKAFRQRLRES